MRQIMNSPMMQNFMSNPELLRDMVTNNPQMRAVLDANPQLNHVLGDPELMRQTMEAIRNPAQMREMQRSQDLAMAHLENHPEGFNALRRMYEDVQEPLMQATADAAQQPPGAGGAAAAPSGVLPNPWASPSAAGAGA